MENKTILNKQECYKILNMNRVEFDKLVNSGIIIPIPNLDGPDKFGSKHIQEVKEYLAGEYIDNI